MKGKPNEIGFEVHWNEYLKTFMKSSVFITYMNVWNLNNKNLCNQYMDQGYEKSKAQKAMVPKSYI